MSTEDIFEVEIKDVYNYRLSYGGQSAYFHGLQAGKMVGSKCTGCGFVWVPLRPVCSHCYETAEEYPLSGKGEILTSILLPQIPEHLRHLNAPVATALVLPEGADTCIKAFVVAHNNVTLGKGTRVKAKYLPKINSIADFYFVPEESGD
ncbi:MAG: hypothetical protein GX070_08365 [Alcaligenaceae bacterium]|nr:hypothetical protein [Alcaligenaceae bacterium]